MDYKDYIKGIINGNPFSMTRKLLMLLCCWMVGMLSTADAQDLFTECCGYTFTAPTTTGANILTNGTDTYTIVSLITSYHDNSFASSPALPLFVIATIETLKTKGYILDSEKTQLEALTW